MIEGGRSGCRVIIIYERVQRMGIVVVPICAVCVSRWWRGRHRVAYCALCLLRAYDNLGMFELNVRIYSCGDSWTSDEGNAAHGHVSRRSYCIINCGFRYSLHR